MKASLAVTLVVNHLSLRTASQNNNCVTSHTGRFRVEEEVWSRKSDLYVG